LSKAYQLFEEQISLSSFLRICREVAYGIMLKLKTPIISRKYEQCYWQVGRCRRILYAARIITDLEAYHSIESL
jgi:hypothetical protein